MYGPTVRLLSYLWRKHVFPAALDHVLGPPHQPQCSVCSQVAQVARAQPAVCTERLQGRAWVWMWMRQNMQLLFCDCAQHGAGGAWSTRCASPTAAVFPTRAEWPYGCGGRAQWHCATQVQQDVLYLCVQHGRTNTIFLAYAEHHRGRSSSGGATTWLCGCVVADDVCWWCNRTWLCGHWST